MRWDGWGGGEVRVERVGAVTTVILARPERRNAVDGPMARVADAFREFDASDASVAVLAGDGPAFCAGADLTAIGTDRGNTVDPDPSGDWPTAISRMRLSKPVIAAASGLRGRRASRWRCWSWPPRAAMKTATSRASWRWGCAC